MKKQLSPPEWAEEFAQFVSSEGTTPPAHLTNQMLSQVKSDLNPSVWSVFAKMALIHVLVGTLTLLFCPQFGVQLGGGQGLMGYLMQFGERICMIGCGAEFTIGTALVATLVLRPEEIRVIRRTELLQFSVLGLLSLGAFICLGGGVVISFAAFWLLGLLVSGTASLELGWLLRRKLLLN